ncbi:MAG: hypothetical protein E7176_03800 [Erysipelotrichaceae bacterium]|nr:hypothetical protein [Erysipelotrichaceae bacterium]
MKCLTNLDRITYPSDLVMDLTKLYRFKGKDFYYEDVLKATMSGIVRVTVEKDTFYAAKLLNLSVTENRMRLIIKKDTTPRTKDEKTLSNLKAVFTLIQKKGDSIELTTNEFLQLAKKIFSDSQNIDFASEVVKVRHNLIEEKKRISKRDDLEKELKEYGKLLAAGNVEPTQLITNLYVDLLHMNIYTSNNDFMALLIYYCLIFRERFNAFKYISFFQLYFENKDKFDNARISASYDWEHGFSQTAPLNRVTINIMLDAYQQVENSIDDFKFDKNIRKIDNVETTILKFGNVFTREQIKNAHPHLSESTINRALANLKAQNKIRSTGTGRAATWVKLVPNEMLGSRIKQMTLFDLIMENEED